MRPLRIGVNALYLIPGGVGGTEIYLRQLLQALGEVDGRNEYLVFINRETGPDLAPRLPNFTLVRQPVRASFRPARIVWEQTVLPAERITRTLLIAEALVSLRSLAHLSQSHTLFGREHLMKNPCFRQ